MKKKKHRKLVDVGIEKYVSWEKLNLWKLSSVVDRKYQIFCHDTKNWSKKNTKIKSKTDFYWIYGFVENQFQKKYKKSW